LLQSSRNVLLAVYNITDKTNHRLYLNPIADFEFGINAAIIRPENVEPPLIKGNYSNLRLRNVLYVTKTFVRLPPNYLR
jgi:hypothetical protein